HHAEYGEMVACGCRKPAPGMILQAVADFNVDIAGSYMIGDKTVDMQAAIAAGVFPVMVATGYGREQKEQAPHGIAFVENLHGAVELIEKGLLSSASPQNDDNRCHPEGGSAAVVILKESSTEGSK
ncbi:MAG: HAD hydrolase-like protein, partial [Nitrospinae bacterium]|nr:HAD hydrolase-like protein [Nitrospinota bacterium]